MHSKLLLSLLLLVGSSSIGYWSYQNGYLPAFGSTAIEGSYRIDLSEILIEDAQSDFEKVILLVSSSQLNIVVNFYSNNKGLVTMVNDGFVSSLIIAGMKKDNPDFTSDMEFEYHIKGKRITITPKGHKSEVLDLETTANHFDILRIGQNGKFIKLIKR